MMAEAIAAYPTNKEEGRNEDRVNTPETPNRDFEMVFRRRKRMVNLTSIPFFILAAIALLARLTHGRFLAIPFSIAGPVAYAAFIVTFAVHAIIWRCPSCGGYLGLVASSKFCPKCGTRLDRRPGEEPRTGDRP
jgi:hypothetical protein